MCVRTGWWVRQALSEENPRDPNPPKTNAWGLRNSGGIPYVSTRFSLSMETSSLTRDGTAEPPSRGTKFSGANGDREKIVFPVQLTTSRIDILYPVDP